MNNINEKLKQIRELMKQNNIDTYIITKYDPHQSENSQEHWMSVMFISGFTGSAGTVVITQNHAGLWTDGRYYIQAKNQLDGSEFVLHKAAEPSTKGFADFAVDETAKNGAIGFDGRTVSATFANNLEKKAEKKQVKLVNEIDLVGKLWCDRPQLSQNKAYDFLVKYCGKSRQEKIKEVIAEIEKENADVYVVSQNDDIAWLFNLRGNDTKNVTSFASYAVVEKNSTTLFADKSKLLDVIETLESENIVVKEYDEIFDFIKTIDKNYKVLINKGAANFSLYKSIIDNNNKNVINIETDITTNLKAIKNDIEINNLEKVNVRDGVAMVKFIKWVREVAKEGKYTECDASDYLQNLRSKGENFLMTSFDTIAGYMGNAAMMHYFPTKENCAVIKENGMLLVDSGGHYLDGTTDITRTIAVGEVTDEMKHDFTLVLKSHIALSNAVFMEGTTGANIDILARLPMWKEGKDYKCGTGHGLGFCLNVHEGPQGISLRSSKVALKEGMVTTNEPGYYLQDKYGIRTENTIIVVPDKKTEWGNFFKFRTISYCPIDLNIVDCSMLDEDEKNWLNDYHEMVYAKLSNQLDEVEKEWLKEETRKIS